jgi:threonylcarbamoyladenosine tRNA methylthiotransferase MtaB
MKVAFTTLGCRTNQHDTAEMQVILEKEGYSIVGSSETADVYVVNTCTVTARSDYSSRLAVKKSLAINENATVVFTGCYAQLNPEESAKMEGLDIVLGNADKLKIAEVLKTKLKNNSFQKESGLAEIYMSDIHADREFQTLPITQFQGRTKAFIKVQTGCNENCSFCTVVRARGSSASDTRGNILDNIRHAIDGGYKEITLTGINLGTWGMDFHSKETFSSLVEEIADLNGNFRVRLSSINPMEIDDHLIELVAQHEKICPHLHIPLQSGDTEILSKMKRNYDAKQYENIVRRAVDSIPSLGLGADVIVGFPGESEESFERTRRLIKELPFSYLHVFSYSPRSGTEAHSFRNNIKNITKKKRNLILSDLVKEKAHLFYKSFIGKKVTVLIEERKQADGLLKGHSEHYLPVRVDAEGALQNQLVSVLITEAQQNELVGCLES